MVSFYFLKQMKFIPMRKQATMLREALLGSLLGKGLPQLSQSIVDIALVDAQAQSPNP